MDSHMELDLTDLSQLAGQLHKVQQTTAETATVGHEVAQLQVQATRELAQAIGVLAAAIVKLADSGGI